jgi:hypothetical protein
MKAVLVRHQKVTDERGNTVEVKIWHLSERKDDKPHGYRYSLAYIVDGKRSSAMTMERVRGITATTKERKALTPLRVSTSFLRISLRT